MSVVITGMDIKGDCFHCDFCRQSSGFYDKCGITNTGITAAIGTMPNCPLKSVEGLIEKITEMPCGITSMQEIYVNRNRVIEIIKEYCEVEA